MTDVIGCVEAEAATLGCLLRMTQHDALSLVDQLAVEDFTDARHRLVLEAARQCLYDGAPADPITVLAELRRTGDERSFTADRSAGVYLIGLLEAAPASASAGHYARAVVEHSVRRQVETAAVRLQDQAGVLAFAELTALALEEWSEIVRQLDRVSPTARELIQ